MTTKPVQDPLISMVQKWYKTGMIATSTVLFTTNTVMGFSQHRGNGLFHNEWKHAKTPFEKASLTVFVVGYSTIKSGSLSLIWPLTIMQGVHYVRHKDSWWKNRILFPYREEMRGY